MQDWVAANERRFTIDGNPSAGWYEGTDLYFLPASFNAVLGEGNFHPARIRRDFAQEGLIRRGLKEFTVTRTNPHHDRTDRVIHLPNFFRNSPDTETFIESEIRRDTLEVEEQELPVIPSDSAQTSLLN